MRRFIIGMMIVGLAAWIGGAAFGHGAARADAPIEGRAGRAELRFLEGMIDHHQMALDMANDCLAKSLTESVRLLCQAIIDAQSAEITLMRDWLLAWYNVAYTPVSMLPTDAAHDPHAGHGGMTMPDTDPAMMMGMFAGLNRLTGVAYEMAWLEAMIDHHDDALHMAERLLTRSTPDAPLHAELTALAEAIIVAQTAEIAHMEQMLLELNG
jgi:uncharacterized protein (DUF305 family)